MSYQLDLGKFADVMDAKTIIDWYIPKIRVIYYNYNGKNLLQGDFPDLFEQLNFFVIKRDRDRLLKECKEKIKETKKFLDLDKKQQKRLRNKERIEEQQQLINEKEEFLIQCDTMYNHLLTQ